MSTILYICVHFSLIFNLKMKLNFKAKNAYFQSRKWNMTLESFHLKIKDIFFFIFD